MGDTDRSKAAHTDSTLLAGSVTSRFSLGMVCSYGMLTYMPLENFDQMGLVHLALCLRLHIVVDFRNIRCRQEAQWGRGAS